MKSRPTIFLSGVSHEFGSFRDAIENEIEMKGCHAENQPGFPPDYRTVEEMLRRKLHDADAVIHIVGFRFGAEPNLRPADAPRRSYTQLEFDIAVQLGKPVYRFLSVSAAVRDKPRTKLDPEDAEAEAIQLAHREAVQKTNHLYYFFKDKAELCKLVAEIPEVQAADFRADISRIIKYAPVELIGREADLAVLSAAWEKVRRVESPRPHVVTFVALGGEGKTSLVAKWVADLAHRDWPGCDAAFAWSFYSQGTREQAAVSSDLFLAEALAFFGDPAMAGSAAGAFDKGRRLAQLVGERRALLILDGLEPLQYAPTSPTPGELKDQGVAALLKGLAATSHGLCVVTTRYSLPDLKAFWQTTAPELKLPRLSPTAGVALLRSLGVHGTPQQFETLVEDVKGHALTLNLLGSYLRDAYAGDIRKRDLLKLEEADAEEQGGHAFRVMDAYVTWLEQEGSVEQEGTKATKGTGARKKSGGARNVGPDQQQPATSSSPSGFVPAVPFCSNSSPGQRALAILRLLGLFDRPATADCLAALLQAPAIPGLTEPLVGMTEAQRNIAFTRLESARLLTVNRDKADTLVSLDAHPLLREYFARQLKLTRSISEGMTDTATSPNDPSLTPQVGEAWRAAHRRLYEHLCATTKEGDQPQLEDLQPLYQAVAHGCHAGLQQETCNKVFFTRILRHNEGYSANKLGAFGSDLGAVVCFFETPWSRVSPAFADDAQALLLANSAFCLRGLGRLIEALEPMRAGLEMYVTRKDWKEAAILANNLSELELTLGDVPGAVGDAEQSVTYADRSGDAFQKMVNRTTHADALYQAGHLAEAEVLFREAEQMQAERHPTNPLLYSTSGLKYCDLLLTEAERAGWQRMQKPEVRSQKSELGNASRAVFERATKTLKIAEQHFGLLANAVDHLTLGRAAFYAAMLGPTGLSVGSKSTEAAQHVPTAGELATSRRELDAAISGLRRAGTTHHLPRGLLTRAWLRFVEGKRTGFDSAQSDLDEAWVIAERGSMKLFLTDIHLHRARLFGVRNSEGRVRREGEDKYPWESPAADLAAAETLIKVCGYHRRDGELADAKAALL